MKIYFLITLIAIVFAMPLHAASVKVNVTGAIKSAYFYSFSFLDANSNQYGEVSSRYIYPQSQELIGFHRRDDMLATTGSMILTDTLPFGRLAEPEIAFSNCSGILTFVCYGTIFDQVLKGFGYNFFPENSSSVSADFNPSRLIYVDDADYLWSNDLGVFNAGSGVKLEFDFNSFSVEVIPVPGSSVLLLTGILLGGGFIRLKRSRKA